MHPDPWPGGLSFALTPLACFFQSEPEGFSHFHLYVCAAFLVRWRKEILEERDFQVSKRPAGEPGRFPARRGLLNVGSQQHLWKACESQLCGSLSGVARGLVGLVAGWGALDVAVSSA